MFARQSVGRATRALTARRTYASSVSTSSVGGVQVAAFDNGAPTSSISVVVKAGSRFETAPGVAHALKNFAFKSTDAGSALKTVRETELYGGILSSTLTREHLLLNAEFLRGDEEYFLGILANVLSSTKYTRHEFSELVVPTVEADAMNAFGDSTVLALDAVHQLAFRRGLGNSLFAMPHSPLTVQQVQNYAAQAYAKSNIAVVGTGISADTLSRAVQKAFGSSSAAGSSLSGGKTSYFGGEQRIPLDGHGSSSSKPTLVIAYGTNSAPSADLKALPHLLGAGSPLKWAPGVSPLAQASDKVAGGSAKAFLLPYSDASLFGVVVQAPTSEAVRTLATDVANQLKEFAGKVGEEDAKRAVAQAKFASASALESKDSLVLEAGRQILAGSVQSVDEVLSSFSQVSASSLTKSAGELLKSKPSIVAVGNLHVLPYADELGL